MLNQSLSIDDLLKNIRSKTRDRTHLIPQRNRAALLVIDMQKFFCDEQGRAYFPSSRLALDHILRLLSFWREGGSVYFTQHSHQGPAELGPSDLGPSDLGMIGKFYRDYIHTGERDADLLPELCLSKQESHESVIRKFTYDAFYKTDLESRLKSKHIDQVIICGVLTHLCCDTTARSAFVRGFEVYIAADAVASDSDEFHINSLINLADGVARILSTQEILTLCR